MKKALLFALDKHKSQKRKGKDEPYVTHLLSVLSILMKENVDKTLLQAGLLHDVVEDNKETGVTEKQLRKEFGNKVTDLVMAVTEKDKSKSWKDRKLICLEHLKKASKEVKILKCADALANIQDLRDDMNLKQIKWGRFNAGEEDQEWYYSSILKASKEIKNTSLYKKLKLAYKEVFDDILSLKAVMKASEKHYKMIRRIEDDSYEDIKESAGSKGWKKV